MSQDKRWWEEEFKQQFCVEDDFRRSEISFLSKKPSNNYAQSDGVTIAEDLLSFISKIEDKAREEERRNIGWDKARSAALEINAWDEARNEGIELVLDALRKLAKPTE